MKFDYQIFVAFRYLLNNPQRGSLRTFLVVLAGISLQVVALFLRLYGHSLITDVTLVTCAIATWAFWLVAMLRHSKLGLIVYLTSLGIGGLCFLVALLIRLNKLPGLDLEMETQLSASQGFAIAAGVFVGIANLSALAGSLRAYFTFFTVVPIMGVFIGTYSLVLVLSVMNGFESDLQEKILGSNAHVQIAREDGDFTEWRQVKARIDAMPEVVASTPYAVSEVVVAANNNGQNVIIKGIDPKTVGNVTELVKDLEDPNTLQPDRAAIDRLAPLVDDSKDLKVVPAQPSGPVIDPAPADMPPRGEPIDYSGSGSDGSGSAPAAPTGEGRAGFDPLAMPNLPPIPSDPNDRLEPPAPMPAPAAKPAAAVIDPPPPDLVVSTAPPIDFSGSASAEPIDLPVIQVGDVVDSVPMTRRTQSLPGVLIGREAIKQTHMFVGEEVRVVSPLSDPSNPDATGTPIPFNRDYRVAGSFYTGMYEYDLKYIYVSLDSLQEFLDRGDAVDGIEVRVHDPDDTDAFVDKLSEQLGPQYRVQDWKELNRSLFSALKLEKVAMFIVLGIVILVASFAILGNLIMVVVEKQKQIALLKTLGASDLGLMQLFSIQGVMIGLIGTILGVGLGLLFCRFAEVIGIPLDPNVYYIDKMPIHVESSSVALTALAGVLISIAATIYPSILAARVRPAIGMRQ